MEARNERGIGCQADAPVKQEAEMRLQDSTGADSSVSEPPRKWRRVLAAFIEGQSLNRFEAARWLSDHCLHSTVSTIQGKGVRVERRTEKVPGYRGIPTECCRYWLDLEDNNNIARANELMGRALEVVA